MIVGRIGERCRPLKRKEKKNPNLLNSYVRGWGWGKGRHPRRQKAAVKIFWGGESTEDVALGSGHPEIPLPPPPPKRLPWRPSRSRWLSAPRSTAGHRLAVRSAGQEGLSKAEFAGWRSRFRLGLEKEETAGWRQRRCAAKQDDAGNASTAPDQAGWLRRPRVHSAPLPQTPGFRYLTGEGRSGAGRAGHAEPPGARSCGERRRHAARGWMRKRAARPSPGARTARRGLPPPGAQRQGEAQGTTQSLQHPWRRSLHRSGPSLCSVGKTKALVPATWSRAGARECAPQASAFPNADTS